ncbi:hypothetical protein WAI453_006585 [Rhynchosporium graminicola]
MELESDLAYRGVSASEFETVGALVIDLVLHAFKPSALPFNQLDSGFWILDSDFPSSTTFSARLHPLPLSNEGTCTSGSQKPSPPYRAFDYVGVSG